MAAVITGASPGIGLALARAYVAEGAAKVMSSHRPDAIEAAAVKLARSGVRVSRIAADVARREDAAHTIALPIERLGRLDILAQSTRQAGSSIPRTAPTA